MREDAHKYSECCELCGQRFVGRTPAIPRNAYRRHAISHHKRVDPKPMKPRRAQPLKGREYVYGDWDDRYRS